MNLYKVYPRGGDWCCFVFADSRNEARSAMVGYFDNNEAYIDFGACLVAKDTGGDAQICDMDCDRLALHGVKYMTDEESEAQA